MSKESNFVGMVRKWSEIKRHISVLNELGYTDNYLEEADICTGVGSFPSDSVYVLVCTTKEMEICVVGCRTLVEAESVLEEDSGWKLESLWKDDHKLNYKRIIVLE